MTMKNRNSQPTKQSKRRDNTRLLRVSDQVEVRSLDEGFLGSWHAGKVISCNPLLRSVRYDLLLNEDETDNLIEDVSVSPVIDGEFSSESLDTCRGLIRPKPPPLSVLESSYLQYGQCVDMFYKDAWWEGVVFDREDGSQTRRIFFPDQGDELEGQIGMLRISQDWDEVTQEWKPRKNWVFLEIIEEFKKKYPLPISVKQIWYEVREKSGFENLKEWTSVEREIWRDLVLTVMSDNFKMSIMHICNELNFHPKIEFSDLKLHDLLETVMNFSHEVVPFETPHELEIVETIHANVGNSQPCQTLVPDDHVMLEPIPTMIDSEAALPNFAHDLVVVQPEYCPEAVNGYLRLPVAGKGSGCIDRDRKKCILKVRKHLRSIGWTLYNYVRGSGKKEVRYMSPLGIKFPSLRTVCESLINSNGGDCEPTVGAGTINYIEGTNGLSKENGSNLALVAVESREHLLINEEIKSMAVQVHEIGNLGKKKNQGKQYHGQGKQHPKRGTKSREPRKLKGGVHGDSPTVRSRKRARAQEVIGSSHPNPRTVLSWLIDNGVVLPREKVSYKNKNNSTMMEGKITREGIRCSCCEKIWTLSNFEKHAGSKYHRPSANIFLDDGRSLMDCQSQLDQQKGKSRYSRLDKGYRNISGNDYMCSICHNGGELVMCDRCPSSFHKECLGLKDVPEGEWFCPPCRCEICGLGEHLNDSPVLVCSQCERLYHVRCHDTRGTENMERHREGNWFCRDSCKKIFDGLCKSLGKPIPLLGIEDMTWTLVKPMECNSSDDLFENSNSKLHVALSVMHECFEPLKEPDSRNDLVEDVIFCRRSNLNRLNFQGFYTVLLEKKDELVSAAIVRILGEKVAEVPLVATRFRYRRLGLCRALMDQLEKELKILGVERLVLPAIPTVLNTWTTSFGFSVMSESERLNLLNHTFMGFEGTTVCQKFLTDVPSSTLSTGTRDINYDVNRTANTKMDQDSMISEVFQADQLEEIDNMAQRSLRGTDNSKGSSSSQVATSLDQQFPLSFHQTYSYDYLVRNEDDFRWKRRR